MLNAVVILRNKHYARTLATIRFNYDGKSNHLPQIVYVDSWKEGFEFCWKEGLAKVLFVESGTVFNDFENFCSSLDVKKPFIGNQRLFFVNTDLYTSKDIDNLNEATINKNLEPASWSSTQSNMVEFLDTPAQLFDWENKQQSYVERITNHLWITNNEILYPVKGSQFIGPASGACWWLNLCRPEILKATLVDISYRQLDFARWLLDTWDGKDFGSFIVHYMYRNHVRSFTVDQDDVDVIQLLRSGTMANYVNTWLDSNLVKFGITDVTKAWANARLKPVKMFNEDLVPWVLAHDDLDGLWCSNVSNFKYSLLHNSWENLEAFNAKVTNGQKIN